MNLYLPVWLYKVRYELAWGRPHSEIDNLVLDVLVERAATLADLCEIFALRSELVVEVLVTLARSGWIALDVSNGAFRATPAGQRALARSELPPFINIEPRFEMLIVERLRGGIASRGEVDFFQARVLEQDPRFSKGQVPGEFRARHLDGGQVDGLLPCERPYWLRWVDTPAFVSETHWTPVHVDVDRAEISGLPERWRRALGEELLDFAAGLEGRPRPAVRLQIEGGKASPLTPWHPIELRPEDIVTTAEGHAGLLINALQNAHSAVHVASAFCKPSVLGPETKVAILEALRRDVRVSLLWGYEEGTGARAAVQWMQEIRKEAGEFAHHLHFNHVASGSHAKFLFHDVAGQPQLYLGSYNWLSSPPVADASSPRNITIRIREGSLLAESLRTFAALWRNVPQQPWSSAAEHLQQIASELSENLLSAPPSAGQPSMRARLIRDQEHEAVMWDMLHRTRERCWVASHKLGEKAPIRLQPLANRTQAGSLRVVVHYDLSFLETGRFKDLSAVLAARGVSLARSPRLHAKCVVADEAAIVSSYNFLSADPFDNATNAREVGLLVEGGALATRLWDEFAASGAPDAAPGRELSS